ncbi:MAG: hypothetical protein JNK54_00880 [Elusimicrobia bacterium]|jgi:hypothetical protein|nr:hypothetical protein [Elusimicrobiota bacterium]
MATTLQALRWWATGTLIAVALVGGGIVALFPLGRPMVWGVGVAVLLVVPSYWSLSLTLRLSNPKFFGAFVGGLLGRMAGLGVGGAVVWWHEPSLVVPFLLAAVIGMVGLSFIELFFIGRQNRLTI